MRKNTIWPILAFAFCFVLPPSIGMAQDKSVQLPDVSVSAQRKKAKPPLLDSLNRKSPVLELHQGLPVGGMLLRSYGASGSGSVIFRGTQSAHTQILWNDISLQNPFLAQADASLFSGILIKGARLQIGGSSLAATSGNFGGCIVLSTEAESNEPRIRIGTTIDGTGNWRSYNQIQIRKEKQEFRLRTWSNLDQNRFAVSESPWRTRQEHSERRFLGLEGGFQHRISEKTRFGLDFWWQKSNRNLGPGIWEPYSQASQRDEATRLSLHFNQQNPLGEWKASLGMNSERLAYSDPLHDTQSDSRWITWVPALSWKRDFRNWHWEGVIRSEETHILQAEGMTGMRENRSSAFVKSRFNTSEIPVSAEISLRKEIWTSSNSGTQSGLLLPSFLLEWKPDRNLFSFGIHRKQRFPSLNDRFWPGAGNPELKPEIGWNLEAGWKRKCALGGIRICPGFNLYQTQFQESIQWVPHANHWQAINTGRIRIQGMEGNLSLETGTKNRYLRFLVEGQWCSSQSREERFSGDVSTGKQRMYIPEWQFQNSLMGGWDRISARIQNAWTGSRNLDPEGNQKLPSFCLWEAQLQYEFQKKNQTCRVFTEVRNLSNRQYQWLAGYPMPGRVFSLGLEWTLH